MRPPKASKALVTDKDETFLVEIENMQKAPKRIKRKPLSYPNCSRIYNPRRKNLKAN